jgi:hypothetical protein
MKLLLNLFFILTSSYLISQEVKCQKNERESNELTTSLKGKFSISFVDVPILDSTIGRNGEGKSIHYILKQEPGVIYQLEWRKKLENDHPENVYLVEKFGLEYARRATVNDFKLIKQGKESRIIFDAYSKDETFHFMIVLSKTHYYCLTVFNESMEDISLLKDSFFNSFSIQ